jgi:hypothetical protein
VSAVIFGAASLSLALPHASIAQAVDTAGSGIWDETFAGSELEDYLRVLQVAGRVPLRPWSIRAFSPAEVHALVRAAGPHPWSAHLGTPPEPGPGLKAHLLRPSISSYYNTAFPFGGNDGAVWQGRGLTMAASAGVATNYGPVSLVLAPEVFWAQNSSFALRDNGLSADRRFENGGAPGEIDLPQRFGDGAYARVDPGQSTLRIDTHGVAAGVSTANEYWGPATRMPIILGNNAAGFPHIFLGTAAPVNVGIGRLHGRVIWGRLSQSDYTPMPADSATSFGSGIVLAFTPRGAPGLEIGGARFFHAIWGDTGPSVNDYLRPFGGLLKANSSDPDDQNARERSVNQLASVFFRWALPRSGFEFYGEYGREDANWDLRDLLLEPDHSGGYMLGLRKVWGDSLADHLTAFRAELLNTEVTRLAQVRPQTQFYRHVFLRQGHTELGQALGSYNGFGGGGVTVALDRYGEAGRWTAYVARDVVDSQALVRNPTSRRDVQFSVGGEGLRYLGRAAVTAGAGLVFEQYRDLRAGARNLNVTVSVAYPF